MMPRLLRLALINFNASFIDKAVNSSEISSKFSKLIILLEEITFLAKSII